MISLNPEISSVERRDISKSGDIMARGHDIAAVGDIFQNGPWYLKTRQYNKTFGDIPPLRYLSGSHDIFKSRDISPLSHDIIGGAIP